MKTLNRFFNKLHSRKIRAPRMLAGALVVAMLSLTTACSLTGDNSDDDDSLTSLLALASLCSPTTSASYRLTFDAVWSAATHPENFPANPHFSPLVGATHSSANLIWQSGGTATTGVKNVAETGSRTQLATEIGVFQGLGTAQTLIQSTAGVATSPGSVSTEFTTNNCNALVSVITMIAPSPDWFVGVNSMNLLSGGAFVSSATHTLFAYDAGTDSGTTFTSADSATNPQGTIAELTELPFVSAGTKRSMGTFTFTKL